ncbi:hypothetical protein ACFU99_09895 [Streptomyces sp. NPDC057654]|uniref:hypothetical protein n=1 Tax=Streptomyces sp. NPDC057654 TaxID=3346196 RepID=UPI003688E5E5
MADQEKPQEPAAGATGRLAEEDRHGFVSAFVGGVRSDGDQGRSGKRVVAVGIAVVAAVGLGAVAVGALTGGDDTKKKDVADKLSPAAAASQADRHGQGQNSQSSVSHNGGTGTNGGGSGGGGTNGAGGDSGNNTVADGHREAQSDDGHKGSPSSGPTTGSGSGSGKSSSSSSASSSSHSANSAHAPTVSQFAAPAYSALAGYGCPSNDSAKIWTKDANFGHGSSGWLKSSSGGYAGSGCNGQYLSIPMSGSSSSYDSTQYVLWKFDYSSKIKGAASCSLAVYVPDNGDIQHVGGAPARYALYNSDHSGGKTAGSFNISQVGNRGKWVSQGPFKVSGGKLTLKLFNTGVDYTSSTKHAHDAAAPVRLSCNSA